MTSEQYQAYIQWRLRYLHNWHFQVSQSYARHLDSQAVVLGAVAYMLSRWLVVGLWKAFIILQIVLNGTNLLYEAWAIAKLMLFKPYIELTEGSSYGRVTKKNDVVVPTIPCTYTYRPISPGVFCRVLLLKPALFSTADLQGELIDLPCNVSCEYAALSYCWGEERASDFIVIGNKQLSITTNCGEALRHLRHRLKARMLWVDSICIDQQNLEEKSQQLRCMNQIYSKSFETVVWLGKGTAASYLGLHYARAHAMFGFLPQRLSARLQSSLQDRFQEREHGFAVRDLLRRPWFRRIWTLQEAALIQPDRVKLLCGAFVVSYDLIKHSLWVLSVYTSVKRGPYFFRGVSADSAIVTRSDVRNAVLNLKEKQISFEFSPLMMRLQDQEATDPRDMIYGLLGVFEVAGLSLYDEATYTKTIGEVYRDAMVAVCKHESSLRLLQLLGEERRQDMSEVPTWVPDFRGPPTVRRAYSRYFNSASDSTAEFEIQTGNTVLQTTAFVVDKIRKVSTRTVWQPDTADEKQTDHVTKNLEEGAQQTIMALREWVWIAANFSNAEDWEGTLDAFRETLLYESELTSYIPSPAGNFTDWLSIMMSTDPSWSDLPIATVFETERDKYYRKDVESILQRHAYNNSTIQERFLDPSAPLHHLTRDPCWRIMCALKTGSTLSVTHSQIWMLAMDTAFFVTDAGRMGTGPVHILEDDEIALIPGVNMPMILRKHGRFYRVVGPAYVSGMMKRDLWDSLWSRCPEDLRQIYLI